MLQRRNTYLFYSRKNFYWFSSHEWNYQTKKILKISSITILLKKKKLKKYVTIMQKKIFYFSLSLSSLPSLAFTYVVIRYSILRERFCGFRYSLAVRSYLLFCAALGTWENDIKPPPKRALAVQRNTLSKSTLSRCPLRSKFKDLLTPHSSRNVLKRSIHPNPTIFFSLFPFLLFFTIESIEVQRHIAFIDGIILTGIFNVMPVAWNLNRTRSSLMVTHVEGH